MIRVGTEYSAGPNIDIQDDVISGKDWTEEIAEASANAYNAATAQIPDPFDPSYLSAQIDNKLNSSDFTTWQNGQYSTDLQTIEGQISNKLDESSFSQVSASFLTAINIPESATWNEVSQAYEQASATYLTSVSIPESATWQDVSTTVQSNSAQWAEGGTGGDEEVNSFVYENSATILDVNSTYQENSATYLTSHQDISYKLDTTAFSTVSGDFLTAAPADMATTGDVAELAQTISETYQVKGDYLTTADSANFYPNDNPSGFITGVDLSNYYTKDETSGKEELSNAFANVPTPDYEVESYIHNNSATLDGTSTVVQSNSSTWSDVTAYQSNSASYLTAHQSLEGYATEQWVGEQGYLTEISIPESADWNEATTTVQTNSSNWDNVINKLDTTSFSDVSGTFLTAVDLTPYQTIEGMTAYQPVGDYTTTAEVDTLSSMLSGAIDYVSANAGDEFPVSADEAIQYVQTNSANIDETVTSFQTNSSTYMVEPNLEYNAVNEISGYNGSAIAQYGAEKQWLVHDDTLVHAANSAQYALGVNLSAVAQLLGVDETVLFSGSTQSPNLTDSIWNYKKISLLIGDDTTNTKVSNSQMYYTDDIAAFGSGFSIFQTCKRKDGGYISMGAYINVNNGGTGFTVASVGGWASWDNSTCQYQGAGTWAPRFYKVIGIGRKQ